jgi:hypothetical protein
LIYAFFILGGFVTAIGQDMDSGTRIFCVIRILVSADIAFLVIKSNQEKIEKNNIGTKQPLGKRFEDIKEVMVSKKDELQEHLKIA